MTARPLAQLTDEELELAYQAELARLGIGSEEQAQEELERQPAEQLEYWSRLGVEQPLADALLWEREDAPWDQRRLIAALTVALTLVRGGNRSGKTYAILQYCVAMALGRDHPAVAAWLEDNELPATLIPEGPGEVILAAPTAAQSLQIHRKRLERLLPDGGKTWYGLNSPTAGARVELEVEGYTRPGVIWFKSYDQGHRSFKGSEVRLCALSEEPEGDEGGLILEECLRGCSSVGGRVVLEMTPQNGKTWVHDRLFEGQEFGCQDIELNTEHNVMLPNYDSTMTWLAGMSEEKREVRQYGRFIDQRGLVYPAWERGNGDRYGPGHHCEPFDIPEDWTRFRTADFGMVNPTCILWGAQGDDDTLYIYRQLYEPSPSYELHAQFCADLEAKLKEAIEAGWGDPSNPSAISTFCARDCYMRGADNAVDAGISKVSDRLRLWPDGRPRIKVFRRSRVSMLVPEEKWPELPCAITKEIENYRWNPIMKVPVPIKKDDHAMDCLRYKCAGVARWQGQ